MAIKIKNKDKRNVETEEEVDLGGGAGGADSFEKAAFRATAWVEDNRRTLAIGAAAVVVVILAGLVAMQVVRGQEMDASDRLSEGLAAYSAPVEGSPVLEAIQSQPEAPQFATIHESDEAKWSAVEAGAQATLADFDSGAIGDSARMTKAASAMNLQRYEEAEGLYREVLAGEELDEDLLAYANVGLANALAAQGDVESAGEAWQQFAELRPAQKGYADLVVARLTDRHGDSEEARALYEAFLEDYPQSEHRDEVARRLALM